MACVLRRSGPFLPVRISDARDGRLNSLDIILLDENLLDFVADDLDDQLVKLLSVFGLLEVLIDIESHCGGWLLRLCLGGSVSELPSRYQSLANRRFYCESLGSAFFPLSLIFN